MQQELDFLISFSDGVLTKIPTASYAKTSTDDENDNEGPLMILMSSGCAFLKAQYKSIAFASYQLHIYIHCALNKLMNNSLMVSLSNLSCYTHTQGV